MVLDIVLFFNRIQFLSQCYLYNSTSVCDSLDAQGPKLVVPKRRNTDSLLL